MINMSQFTNTVADNTVVVNGASFKVTDDVALKVLTQYLMKWKIKEK